MRRLIIYSIYSDDGNIKDNVEHVLFNLKTISTRIIIVVNGKLFVTEKKRLYKCTEEIIERENEGYDYNAYRDVLLFYLEENEIAEYDEIVLCNDTFYGFFFPIEQIFEEMEQRECDIWGLNKVQRGLLDHIQSYLLVFKKNVIRNYDLVYYFRKYKVNTNSYGQTVAYIESNLYLFYSNKGYVLDSYTYTEEIDIYANPDICINDYGLPIIKKKCFNANYCDQDVLDAVLENLEDRGFSISQNNVLPARYSVHIGRRKLAKALIGKDELLDWANKGEYYIFGHGNIAYELYYTYFEENGNFKGFVVSKDNQSGNDVYSLNEIPINARIIIGVKQELQEEICSILPDSMEKLLLWEI